MIPAQHTIPHKNCCSSKWILVLQIISHVMQSWCEEFFLIIGLGHYRDFLTNDHPCAIHNSIAICVEFLFSSTLEIFNAVQRSCDATSEWTALKFWIAIQKKSLFATRKVYTTLPVKIIGQNKDHAVLRNTFYFLHHIKLFTLFATFQLLFISLFQWFFPTNFDGM